MTSSCGNMESSAGVRCRTNSGCTTPRSVVRCHDVTEFRRSDVQISCVWPRIAAGIRKQPSDVFSDGDGDHYWISILMAFIITFVGNGFAKSFSVIQSGVTVEFPNTSASNTTWANQLLAVVTALTAPLAGKLIAKTGLRTSAAAGALLCSIGLCSSYFATSASFLNASIGVYMGIGISVLSKCAAGCTDRCFGKWKATLMSIALSGGCFGAIAVPSLVEILVGYIGLKLTLVVWAGVFGLLAVTSVVYIDDACNISRLVDDSHAMQEGSSSKEIHAVSAQVARDSSARTTYQKSQLIFTVICFLAVVLVKIHCVSIATVELLERGFGANTVAWLGHTAELSDLFARVLCGMPTSAPMLDGGLELTFSLVLFVGGIIGLNISGGLGALVIHTAGAAFGAVVVMMRIDKAVRYQTHEKHIDCTLKLMRSCHGPCGFIHGVLRKLFAA